MAPERKPGHSRRKHGTTRGRRAPLAHADDRAILADLAAKPAVRAFRFIDRGVLPANRPARCDLGLQEQMAVRLLDVAIDVRHLAPVCVRQHRRGWLQRSFYPFRLCRWPRRFSWVVVSPRWQNGPLFTFVSSACRTSGTSSGCMACLSHAEPFHRIWGRHTRRPVRWPTVHPCVRLRRRRPGLFLRRNPPQNLVASCFSLVPTGGADPGSPASGMPGSPVRRPGIQRGSPRPGRRRIQSRGRPPQPASPRVGPR